MTALEEKVAKDKELSDATARYVVEGGEFPGEVIEKKFIQAYGAHTQGAGPEGTDNQLSDAVAQGVAQALKALGIDPKQLNKEQIDAISRETKHPLKPEETEEETGLIDHETDNWFKEQGLEVDESLLPILREMGEAVPH